MRTFSVSSVSLGLRVNVVAMKSSGYSGTPLQKKLGFKEGFKVKVLNTPVYYRELLVDLPDDVQFLKDNKTGKDLIHLFTTEQEELRELLPQLKKQIVDNGCIWVSWPKKSSKVDTDITEDVIRNFALANDLVDVKVCAVDEIWSGLKLVIPINKRGSSK